MRVELTVNSQTRSAEVEPGTALVDLLREQLGLTGVHIGCDTSQCGACTVHLDGRAVKSCAVLAVQADGAQVLTIEGLARHEALHPMQQAFSHCHGLQCGFCTPGMIMAAIDLVNAHPDPSDAQINEGLAGNLCRCTGYLNIVESVRQGAAAMRAVEA